MDCGSYEAMASKVKKSEFVGIGAAIQAIGLIVCFIAFPFGVVAGIISVVEFNHQTPTFFCLRAKLVKFLPRLS